MYKHHNHVCILDIDEELYTFVKNLEIERHHPIFVMGKECYPKRSSQFFSDESKGYAFSNSIAEAKPLPEILKNILKEVNERFTDNFNGILVQKYITGDDYIGAHSDDEKGLGESGVVGISFGANRKLRIREKKTKKIIKDIIMTHGTVMHMHGKFQKYFTHEIPIEKRVKETRWSLTFRRHTK